MLLTLFAVALGALSALAFHVYMWWLRDTVLGLVAGFGFVCFVPIAIVFFLRPTAHTSAANPTLVLLVPLGLALLPLCLGYAHSFALDILWTAWLWIKATFAVYAELVLTLVIPTSIASALYGGWPFYPRSFDFFANTFVLTALLLALIRPIICKLKPQKPALRDLPNNDSSS